ncbi:MAG: DNA methyltransferase, partial [Parvularculaceae bacterium]
MIDSLDALPLFAPPSVASVSDNAHSHSVSVRKQTFAEDVRNFNGLGKQSAAFEEGGVPYIVNEFWTAAQRQAHSIHEVSYRACFKPQLPGFFISRLTAPGEWVYDPFMGRGTTPVETHLLGRKPAGNDINPLSVLLTRPRLRPVSVEAIETALAAIDWDDGDEEAPDLLTFYSERTLRRILALKKWLANKAPLDKTPDPVTDWIRMVAINRLTGHSPGFFSVYTLPPNQAVSVQSQLKINEKRAQTPPDRDVARLILKKSRALLSSGAPAPARDMLFSTAPADRTPDIPTGSVALVVTSPPFLDIVQYRD